MKVTPQANLQAGASEKTGKIKPARHGESAQPIGVQAGLPGSTPSFQSVLDKVIHSGGEREAGRSPEKAPPKEPPTTTQGPASSEQPENLQAYGDSLDQELPNNLLQGGAELLPASDFRIDNQSLTPREILPVTDLEKIVLSVRMNSLPGGQPEVTIALPRSLLEGLRVHLSINQKGRVTAEFLAPNAVIQAQIDGRANELAELLRARGVNLEALTTSVSTELSGNNDGRNQRGYQQTAGSGGVERKPSKELSAEEPGIADEGVTEFLSRTTYRA
jgi:hypothetical protein